VLLRGFGGAVVTVTIVGERRSALPVVGRQHKLTQMRSAARQVASAVVRVTMATRTDGRTRS